MKSKSHASEGTHNFTESLWNRVLVPHTLHLQYRTYTSSIVQRSPNRPCRTGSLNYQFGCDGRG